MLSRSACAPGAYTPANDVTEPSAASASGDLSTPTRTPPQASSSERRSAQSARAPLEAIPCQGCRRIFTPRRPNQRHCSGRCRAAASRHRDVRRLRCLLERLGSEELQQLASAARSLSDVRAAFIQVQGQGQGQEQPEHIGEVPATAPVQGPAPAPRTGTGAGADTDTDTDTDAGTGAGSAPSWT